jgi:hypothetical protein
VRECSRRAQCINNLHQLGLAFHIYYDKHGRFPPAYVADKDGRPLHSWRTLLLPYLDRRDLYETYDFTQPWNGPNNQKLAEEIIDCFRCPSATTKDQTRTSYLAVTGPGTAWSNPRGKSLNRFTDGANQTILLVEVTDSDVHWAEPRDVTLEEALGPPGEGTRVPVGEHCTEGTYWLRSVPLVGSVLFADGSVRQFPSRLSREDLAALLSIDGGEPVDRDRILAAYEPPLWQSLRWDHVVALPLFFVSLVWFWIQLVLDAKTTVGKDEKSEE